jgi:ATP-dependent DNA ligase
VAKRLGSKYKPGRRSPDWIKVKNFERRELVIGGWITHRDGTHRILVGDRDEDSVIFFFAAPFFGIGGCPFGRGERDCSLGKGRVRRP